MVRLHLQFHGGCAQDGLFEACSFISLNRAGLSGYASSCRVGVHGPAMLLCCETCYNIEKSNGSCIYSVCTHSYQDEAVNSSIRSTKVQLVEAIYILERHAVVVASGSGAYCPALLGCSLPTNLRASR